MALIESIIIEYLNEHSGISCPAYGDTPRGQLPNQFILVEKKGNSCRDYIHTALIAVQSYSSISKASAAALNEAIVDAMLDAITLPSISSCKLNSDYDFTDTASKRYRYQAVFNVTYTREV